MKPSQRLLIAATSALILTTPVFATASNVCQLGHQASLEKEYAVAIRLIDVCLRAPENLSTEGIAFAYHVRGWSYHYLGDNERALEDMDKAMFAHRPIDSNYVVDYAYLLREMNQLERSLEFLQIAREKLAEINEGTMQVQYHLGWVLQDMKRHEEAIAAYTAGIPYQPDFPYVFYRRAESFEALGRREEARADFETFIKLATPLWTEHLPKEDRLKYQAKLMEYGLSAKWGG